MSPLPDHITSAIEHDALPVFRDERLMLIYDPWRRDYILDSQGSIARLTGTNLHERSSSRERRKGDILSAYGLRDWKRSFSLRAMPGLSALRLGTDDHIFLYWGERHLARVPEQAAREFVLGLNIERADEQADQVRYWLPEPSGCARMPAFPTHQLMHSRGVHGVYFDPVRELYFEFGADEGPEHVVSSSRRLADLRAPKGAKAWARRIKYIKHGEHVFVFPPAEFRREKLVHRLTPGRQARCQSASIAKWLECADSVLAKWLRAL